MLSIKVEFRRFAEVHLGDLFGTECVYVIWDSRARHCPTYIGEGSILQRLASHSLRNDRIFVPPIDGYVGFLDENLRCSDKDLAQATERLLLDVAVRTERAPAENVRPGNGSLVSLLCEDGLVKLSVRGSDPFANPSQRTILIRPKIVSAQRNFSGKYDICSSWRARRNSRLIV